MRKATEYWGKEYKGKPENKSGGDQLRQEPEGHGRQASWPLPCCRMPRRITARIPNCCGELGRLALEFDQLSLAGRALEVADVPDKPDWKVISARGTVLAKQGQHKAAIPFFERALALAPNQPSVLNNLAMANAMSGDAAKAEEILRTAAAKSDAPAKINQNLALVLGLQGKYEESKIAGSAARLEPGCLREHRLSAPDGPPRTQGLACADTRPARRRHRRLATAPLPWAAKTPAAATATAPAKAPASSNTRPDRLPVSTMPSSRLRSKTHQLGPVGRQPLRQARFRLANSKVLVAERPLTSVHNFYKKRAA